jgi:TRAP-type C4-dicarboxylate transport system permease large subunit
MILIAGAFIINYAVTAEQMDKLLAGWAASQQLSPVAFLLTVNVIFLLLGCILDTGILLFVLVPVLLPTVKLLGIDPVFFGVVMIVNLMIGLITPPYGMLLFVLSALTKSPLGPIVKAVWPFLAALVFALALMILIPEIVLFLPKLAGYGKS